MNRRIYDKYNQKLKFKCTSPYYVNDIVFMKYNTFDDVKKTNEKKKTNSCRICLDSINSPRFYTCECSQSFHIECIDEWICTKISQHGIPSCPLCRKRIILT